MSIYKVLISRYRDKTNRFAEVGTSHNGKFAAIGTGLPTSVEIQNAGWEVTANAKNRVIEFESELYCVQRQDVYKFNSTNDKWEIDHAASGKYQPGGSLDFGDSVTLGLYISAENGVSYLHHIWAASGTDTWRGVRKQSRFTGTGDWEQEVIYTTPFASLSADATYNTSTYGGVLDVLEFNGKIFALTSTAQTTSAESLHNPIIFDLKSNTMAQVTLPPVSFGEKWASTGAFAAHQDRIFFLGYNQTQIGVGSVQINGAVICELIGTDLITKLTLSPVGSPVNRATYDIASSKPIFFSDGEYLYAGPYLDVDTTDGYALYKINPSGIDLVNLGETSGILPLSISRGPFLDPDIDRSDEFVPKVSIYTQVDASGNEEIIFAHFAQTNSGRPGSFWRWQGPNERLKYLGVGHGPEFSLPSFRQGGGAYLWSEHKKIQTQIENIEPSNTVGNATISFRIIGGSGQPAVVRFLYDNNTQFATTFASLEDVKYPVVSSGVVASGNYVTGIIADENIVYKVDWKAQDDGIATGESYVINPVSFIGNLIP